MTDILAWNIKGLNSPNKHEDIKGFLHKQKVGLVALLETKVHEKHIEWVAQRLLVDDNGSQMLNTTPR